MSKLPSDYLKTWAVQLVREHRQICWQHRVDLPSPLIEISSATSYWGQWQPTFRTICLAEQLIRRHPWEVVLNVFRHEMAHQLVSTEQGDEQAHGIAFHRACERLGVPEDYRCAGGALPLARTLPDPLAHDHTRALLEKVRKLLALSESANENESLLAMRKAKELLARHGLPGGTGPTLYCSRVINLKRQRLAGHHRLLATILIDFFQVEVILATIFDPFACREFKCLDLIGRPGQVKVAEYVYSFLIGRLATLWRQHLTECKSTDAAGRNSFYLGDLKGFQERLADGGRQPTLPVATNRTEEMTHWPVPGPDPDREHFLALRYPRLRNSRRRMVRIDTDHYSAGKKQGRRLELHAGLEQKSPNSSPLPLPGAPAK
jgi:hypothetical protein